MNLQPTSLLQRDQNLFASEVDDELVMLSETSGAYFGLNPVGRSIWQLLEHPLPYSALLDKLTEIYEVSREQCAHDVQAFLAEMIAQKLVVVDP